MSGVFEGWRRGFCNPCLLDWIESLWPIITFAFKTRIAVSAVSKCYFFLRIARDSANRSGNQKAAFKTLSEAQMMETNVETVIALGSMKQDKGASDDALNE